MKHNRMINGEAIDALSLTNRAIHYGDGCFSTMAVVKGEVLLFERHMARLQHDAVALSLKGIDWTVLRDEIKQLAQQQARLEKSVLKVILARDGGGQGYSMQGIDSTTRIMTVSPYPEHYALWQERGIHLAVSSVKLGKQPLLAGIKHLNRLEQVLIRQQRDSLNVDDVIVLDSDDKVVECSAGNLFWRRDGIWYTPSLEFAGVKGVMRTHIMALLAQANVNIEVVRVGLEALYQADALFICNTLMGWVRVNQLDGDVRKHYHSCQQDELIASLSLQCNELDHHPDN